MNHPVFVGRRVVNFRNDFDPALLPLVTRDVGVERETPDEVVVAVVTEPDVQTFDAAVMLVKTVVVDRSCYKLTLIQMVPML